MGEDDDKICSACGRQKQDHALIIRDDGVVTAGSIAVPYGDWTICAEVAAAVAFDPTFATFNDRYGYGRNDRALHTHTPLGFYADGWKDGQAALAKLREWLEPLEAWASNVLGIVKERRIPSADVIADGEAITEQARACLE